jgi:glycosyltransferase involved in cell wall biosynthesis
MRTQDPLLSGQRTVALVVTRLNVGGPAVQVMLLAELLRERGYRPLVIHGQISDGEHSMAYLADAKGLRPIEVPDMSRSISWSRDLLALWRLVHLFRRERPLIVHTHTAKAGTLGRIAAMLARVPVRVHTFHGNVFHGYFSPPKTRVFLALERFLARHTDAIVALSASQKQELAETYGVAPADKIQTIRLGLELAPFLAASDGDGRFRAAVGCASEQPLVTWVGRLTQIKRPDMLLQTALAMRAPDAGCRFAVVGEGELRDALEADAAAAGLADVLRFAGLIQDMAPVYADSDLVLLTSENEGTPTVLLEAMAAGRPFVAAAVGGVADLAAGRCQRLEGFEVYGNGILTPLDPQVINRAVRYLIARPELRASMGAAGRDFVMRNFEAQRMGDDIERLYLDLMKEKGLLAQGSLPSAAAAAPR